jgi:hypothetical protein
LDVMTEHQTDSDQACRRSTLKSPSERLKPLKLAIALLVPVVLVTAAVAAAAPLRVIGSGRSSGDFAVAAASGETKNAQAIYLRGYGRRLASLGVVGCSRNFSIGSKSTRFRRMISGRLYRLRLPFAGDCTVTASLSGSGRIRLQILAR